MDRRLVGFGVFFIVFGAVLLGVRQGWIPIEVARRSWQLWPLLLIAWGLSLVFARSAGAWLGGLIVAITLGTMAGGLVATGAGIPIGGCGGDADDGQPFPPQDGTLPADARVSLSFRCGELFVVTKEGTSWSIDGTSDGGRPPSIERTDEGLEIDSPESGGIFGFSGGGENWTVTLPTEPAIGLDVVLNAGSGTLLLAGAHLGSVDHIVNAGSLRVDLRDVAAIAGLDGTINAGSAVVWLPDRALEGELTVNAGTLSVCAPDEVGLRLITGDNPISSNNFDEAGLVRSEDAWESPDFATAAVRITLEIQANAGSLSLNPQQTCSG